MFKQNCWQKKFFQFRLTSNPGIPKYQDLAFCLRIQTQYFSSNSATVSGMMMLNIKSFLAIALSSKTLTMLLPLQNESAYKKRSETLEL